MKELDLFTSDIANILGNFAMAFAVHNGICELFSKNKEVEKNPRVNNFSIYKFLYLWNKFNFLNRIVKFYMLV